MKHYWGAKAIMERLDLRSTTSLYRYIRKLHLPVYLRLAKRFHPWQPMMYTNEHLISSWELAQSETHRENLIKAFDEKYPQLENMQGIKSRKRMLTLAMRKIAEPTSAEFDKDKEEK